MHIEIAGRTPSYTCHREREKIRKSVLAVYEKFGSDSSVFFERYKPALDKLREHPRCFVSGYDGDPSEAIVASDLVVTYTFSSSTLEALSARQKAIYFDPSNRRRGCRYDRIPNLVAHDYDELKCLVQKLLYETTEEDYSEFLDTHVKGVIDPYLDGKAVTRFRKLLSEKADTSFGQSCDLA